MPYTQNSSLAGWGGQDTCDTHLKSAHHWWPSFMKETQRTQGLSASKLV